MTKRLAHWLSCLLVVPACGDNARQSAPPAGPLARGAVERPAQGSADVNVPSGAAAPRAGVPAEAVAAAGHSAPAAPISDSAKSASARRVADPMVSAADRANLAAANRAFAFQLYATLAKTTDGNLFFSPFSISSALAMALAGASGRTAEQIQKTLHFELASPALHAAFNAADHELSSRPSADFSLSITNAMWAQRGTPLLSPFLDTLALNYGAGVELLDFAADAEGARTSINAWISEKTGGHIRDLLQPNDVTGSTAFVLTNAVYFKGKWLRPFEATNTVDGVFHAPQGDETVRLMNAEMRLPYSKGDGYQAVRLAYGESSTEMVVLLPDEGRLAEIESRLDEALWRDIDAHTIYAMVTLTLPRFDFASRSQLGNTLIQLGIADAFNPVDADFSGIDGRRDIVLERVIQEATITVDEHGTEAAAATGSVGEFTEASEPASMVVNRPFLLAIRHQLQGDLLFLGRVQRVKN